MIATGDPSAEGLYRRRFAEHSRRYRHFDMDSAVFILRLVLAYATIKNRLSRRIRGRGMTLAGLNIMSLLEQGEGRSLPLHEISRLMLVSRANITQVMNGLEKKGFVRREHSESDRRLCVARLSHRGLSWLREFWPGHYAEIGRIFSGVSAAEKRRLSAGLGKIILNHGGHDEE